MIVFIYICILVLNILTIMLTYHFLGKDMEKKAKGVFIVVGTAIMYILVTFVYWLSTKGIDLGASAETGKSLITFTFVPVNRFIYITIFGKFIQTFKKGRIKNYSF